jgi:hypothetical protein
MARQRIEQRGVLPADLEEAKATINEALAWVAKQRLRYAELGWKIAEDLTVTVHDEGRPGDAFTVHCVMDTEEGFIPCMEALRGQEAPPSIG